MKNGFTLVELLAVIIIISVITLIVTISINGILDSSKKQLTNVQSKIVEDAAGVWLVDHLDEFSDKIDYCTYITLEEMQDYGYIDGNTVLEYLDEYDPDEIIIKIDLTDGMKYDITVGMDNDNCNKYYDSL